MSAGAHPPTAASLPLTLFGLAVLIAGFVAVFWLWWRYFRSPDDDA